MAVQDKGEAMSEKQGEDRARQRAAEMQGCPQRQMEATLCTSMVQACAGAVAALEGIDPVGPISETEKENAQDVFDEVRQLFSALDARVRGGMGAQTFRAALKALRVCAPVPAAWDGTVRVSRDATLAGLDRIIAERSEQIDIVIEKLVGQLGEENITTSPHPLAAVLRKHTRDRDTLVNARDVISGS
jgi:hypothetical protein